MKLNHLLTTACLTAGLGLHLAITNCAAQSAAAVSVPAPIQDIVKLVKAGLGEEVVLAQIKSTGARSALSADQIIYLHEQGVTQNEIAALLQTGETRAVTPAVPVESNPSSAPTPATPPPLAASPTYAPALSAPAAPTSATVVTAPPATLASFQVQLAPYGTWMDVPGYGLCWRPFVSARDPYWRPYCDQGNWIYTDDGWFWQSDYPWGDIAFHYGRWYRAPRGWVWVPGYDWAPAWVCWRQADAYCGWAPLPPGAVFRAGVGLWYNGHLAVDVDFGLGASLFTFVPYDRFWEHNLHAFILPHDRIEVIFGRSRVVNGYRFEHGRFRVFGLGREHMTTLTRHRILVEAPAHHTERWEHQRGGPPSRHDNHRDRH